MKLKNKIIAVTAALAFLTFAAGSVRADETLVLTITGTTLTQNTNSTTKNGITTVPAPTKTSVTTQLILQALAVDEHAETNYPSATFPAGAKLVVTGHNGDDFQVWGKTNNLLVDVSDILTSSNGNNDISSGKQNEDTGLASPTETDEQLLTLTYDDSFIDGGVGLQFSSTGLITNTQTDSTPKNGVYTETLSGKGALAGEGSLQGNPFVFSGTISAAGTATRSLGP